MSTIHNPKLTSAEIGLLWTQYMNETASICFHTHMMEHIEDKEIMELFEFAMSLSTTHLEKIKEFFKSEGFPQPIGFGNQDVTLNKPRLFSDIFCLNYLNIMSIYGSQGYSAAITASSRQDALQYFTECNSTSIDLCIRTKELLQKKGLYFRPPVISPPERTDFVQHEHFLAGWIGDQRPLSVIEVADIYFNLKKSIVAKAVTLAFSQIASANVRDFFREAVQVKNKHISKFHEVLNDEDLPSSPTLDSEINTTNESPFSDKLMLFQVGFLFSTAMTYYGQGWARSPRADLSPKYAKVILDDVKVGEDCMDIMIKNAWLEQPPLAADRTELSKKG